MDDGSLPARPAALRIKSNASGTGANSGAEDTVRYSRAVKQPFRSQTGFSLSHPIVGTRWRGRRSPGRGILGIYQSLDQSARRAFLDILNRDFSPNPDDVGSAANAYRKDPSSDNLLHLQQVVEPPRQELFRRLSLALDGTRALVQMRSQVLREIDAGAPLQTLAADLGHLLTSWFNRGFLTLQRIDWRSSAAILQKLIEYEAVHQIQGWPDLRRRLEADRRCYAFFHSALPEEPLIFIEVALTRGMSDRVQPLIDPKSAVSDPKAADSAMFYSITNCQEGLRGVPFGNLLIKQVVEDLTKNLPRIRTFSTLSPIPGSRKWLAGSGRDLDTGKLDIQIRRRLVPLCALSGE
jgi:malonyl-CoA decarboxylase